MIIHAFKKNKKQIKKLSVMKYENVHDQMRYFQHCGLIQVSYEKRLNILNITLTLKCKVTNSDETYSQKASLCQKQVSFFASSSFIV